MPDSLPIAHLGCRGHLREETKRQGLEVTISEAPPLVAGPYTTEGFTCPHGVTFWIEPTGEQIAHWVANDIA